MESKINLSYMQQPQTLAEKAVSASPYLIETFNAYYHREVDINFGPPVIYLESVAGCPFSCIMCKPAATKPRRISPELLKLVEPAFTGLEVLAIHGQGEPLMADMDYFVYQSKKHDFVLHMDTNGQLLTKEIAELLLQTRLSIRFSIHAGRPETYYRIMGGDLEKAKQNIRRLVEKSRSSPRGHDFWFSFVVMKENLPEIEEFLHLAHDCGIRSVRFMHLWPNNDTLKGVTVRGFKFKYLEQYNSQIGREFTENLARYTALASELGIKIEWGDKLNDYSSYSRTLGEVTNKVSHRLVGKWFFPLIPTRGFCAAPWLGQLSINQDGNVRLCCSSSAILGNLYQSSLDEIWRGRRMTKIRQAFHNGHYPHECGYCRGFGLSNYPNNSFLSFQRSEGDGKLPGYHSGPPIA
jgi:MoaA/NifB/PqqE/SkfB family radical SAM enzyme